MSREFDRRDISTKNICKWAIRVMPINATMRDFASIGTVAMKTSGNWKGNGWLQFGKRVTVPQQHARVSTTCPGVYFSSGGLAKREDSMYPHRNTFWAAVLPRAKRRKGARCPWLIINKTWSVHSVQCMVKYRWPVEHVKWETCHMGSHVSWFHLWTQKLTSQLWKIYQHPGSLFETNARIHLLPKFPQTSEELRQPQLLAHVYGLLVSCHLCPWFHLSVHFPVFLHLAVGCTAVHVPCGPAGCADVPLVLLRWGSRTTKHAHF